MRSIKALAVDQWRASELSSATFTVPSVGERVAQAATGVMYPPQLAILGLGRITTRTWVVGDHVLPQPMVILMLAPDADLRQTLDLDSMDYLNIIIDLYERTGADIPERDYPELFTLEGAVA